MSEIEVELQRYVDEIHTTADTMLRKAQDLAMDSYNKGKEKGKEEAEEESDDKIEVIQETHVEALEKVEATFVEARNDTFIGGFEYALDLFEQLFTATNGYKVLEELRQYSHTKLQLWKIGTKPDWPPPPIYGHTGKS